MEQDELKAVFDQQAAGYDAQWAKTAPIRDGMYFLLESVFAGLPTDARVLCVGAGTGTELLHLAARFPGWRFTAVEPSGPMLDVCRRRAAEAGVAERCSFHEGYVDTLPVEAKHDAATSFLVSQFILDPKARSAFFREIAGRLEPGGVLASSDLAAGAGTQDYERLLSLWLKVMASADVSPEGLERMRAAYAKDVGIVPPLQVVSIIEAGGFEAATQFYQSGLIHAWFARRAADGTTDTD